MIVNFEIEYSTELKFEGRLIDLHNNFDLIGYEYKSTDRQLILKLAKAMGDWVDKSEFTNLTLTHINVFFLNINYDNKEFEFPNDDKTLADITFYTSEDRNTNDCITAQPKPKNDDDIIYMFQSEHYIRIGCEKIELLIE